MTDQSRIIATHDGGWRYDRPGSPRFLDPMYAREALALIERDEARAEVERLRAVADVARALLYASNNQRWHAGEYLMACDQLCDLLGLGHLKSP